MRIDVDLEYYDSLWQAGDDEFDFEQCIKEWEKMIEEGEPEW